MYIYIYIHTHHFRIHVSRFGMDDIGLIYRFTAIYHVLIIAYKWLPFWILHWHHLLQTRISLIQEHSRISMGNSIILVPMKYYIAKKTRSAEVINSSPLPQPERPTWPHGCARLLQCLGDLGGSHVLLTVAFTGDRISQTAWQPGNMPLQPDRHLLWRFNFLAYNPAIKIQSVHSTPPGRRKLGSAAHPSIWPLPNETSKVSTAFCVLARHFSWCI